MAHAYVTYFDFNYTVKGLAMIKSLLAHDPGSTIRVVCLDDDTFSLLVKMRAVYGGIIPVRLRSIEENDIKLEQAKGNRSRVEYYWTLTPTIMLRFLANMAPDEILTYVDADLLFFSSPDAVFEEIGNNSVLIHGHNFPPAFAHHAANGLYNVGLVSIRNDADGIKVADWWRERCIEWCYNRCENGKMGDQKYLESFATLTNRLAVAKNPGIGVAPWNYMGYDLAEKDGVPTVNAFPAIFFHYHSAELLIPGMLAPCTDLSYPIDKAMLRLFALPYLKSLDAAFAQIREKDPGFAAGFKTSGLTEEMCIIARDDLDAMLREDYPCIIPLADGYIACGSSQFEEGLRECGPVIRAGNLSWTGNYKDWQAAQAESSGYDDPEIFRKALKAACDVRDGKALWERDTVLFHKEQWNWPVVAGLLKAAATHGGRLHVLDFGGSLGSTFVQNRRAFAGLKACTWHVVEQAQLVNAGREELASNELLFHGSIEEALGSAPINAILLSSVLQYLPDPYGFLKETAAYKLPVIIDRTPMLGNYDRLTVQHIPSSIYQASYPCWWLNRERVRTILTSAGYTLSPWFQSAVDPENFLGLCAEPAARSSDSGRRQMEIKGRPIRVMQVDDFYPAYLEAFYAAHPETAAANSRQQGKELLHDGFSAIHAVAPYLSSDKFETEYFISQARPMQQAWAAEQGQAFPEGQDWENEMVRRRIEAFRPDVLYLANPVRFDGSFLTSLAHRPRLVLGWKAADVPWNWNLRGYDIMLSGLPKLLSFAESQGARHGILFKPGMPAWLADAVGTPGKTTDVCFAGSASPGQHAARFAMLDFLAQAAKKHGFSLALHLNCDASVATPAMRPYLRRPVFGLDMQKVLARSRIVFDDRASHGIIMPDGNKNFDLGGDDTINMRLFEAAGSGSFVLTRDLAGVRKYFKPGREIDVWKDLAELERKILYWLAHDEERENMALAAKTRCLDEHGMDAAAKAFGEIIERHIDER